jgi:cysteine-rich repeat protein
MGSTAGANRCHVPTCGDGYRNQAAGEGCDPGGTTDSNACNMALAAGVHRCQAPTCGDGYVNTATTLPEQCDSGTPGADTAECVMTAGAHQCQISSCGDGYVNAAAGEVCDPGGNKALWTTCSQDCKSNLTCGNGVVDPGEDCDTGGTTDTAACNMALTAGAARCHVPKCGDGYVNGTLVGGKPLEECEDGNTNNNDACTNQCKLNICGDGIEYIGVEVCDDGNTVPETDCPYGPTSCEMCNASCTAVETGLTPHYCGDGVVDAGHETCDDGNNNACGECGLNCTGPVSPVQAQGTLTVSGDVAGGMPDHGDGFTINDGNHPAKKFEWVKMGHSASLSPDVQIQFSPISGGSGTTDANTMATATATAINGAGLDVTATATGSSNVVTITHKAPGSGSAVGHVASIALAGGSSGDGISVSQQMTGGAAYDCPAGTGCNDDGDCLNGTCLPSKQCN